ncbi:hypothetical protein LTR94_026522 [Friedmanniomyces endolithicus]|nr:hypothetical protein LTR94_026522 [Friedmanniomyces endolithicus]
MVRTIVALSGTYSAYSADRQFQELLSIVHPSAYNGVRDSLNIVLDELSNNPTLSIATYIRPDQPFQWTDREILVPVEKIRVIGGVNRKFRGTLRIRYAIENGRFSARRGEFRCRDTAHITLLGIWFDSAGARAMWQYGIIARSSIMGSTVMQAPTGSYAA